MEKSRGRLRLFLLLLAASLLPQVSLGSILELNVDDDNDVVRLECFNRFQVMGAANFTFRDPLDGTPVQRHSSTGGLDIPVLSDNETVVSCRIDDGGSTDSTSFAIAGKS